MGVVLLAMTIGGLIIAAILLTFSYFTKKIWLRTFVLGGVFVWFASYAILLFVGSFFSEEKTLALNEPKEFCGFYLDCHLHAAVSDVRKTKTIGDKTASGEFYIVKVKVSSDAKQATLHLIETNAEAFDEGGRIYSRDLEAEKFLPTADVSLNRDVAANASFEKEIVFDISEPAKSVRLLVTEGYGIDHAIEAILIGDEDSIGHRRNYFNLEQQTQTSSVK
ncbi:MAG: DUF4352 domain-containing protein [Pyrinomonadaceae bacterium]